MRRRYIWKHHSRPPLVEYLFYFTVEIVSRAGNAVGNRLAVFDRVLKPSKTVARPLLSQGLRASSSYFLLKKVLPQ